MVKKDSHKNETHNKGKRKGKRQRQTLHYIHSKSSDHEENTQICESHLSILQLHVQEVKVSENPELLLTGSVIQRVLSGSALLWWDTTLPHLHHVQVATRWEDHLERRNEKLYFHSSNTPVKTIILQFSLQIMKVLFSINIWRD